MKNRIDLSVESRETGKHNSRTLRTSRKVPAVIYGAIEPVNVVVAEGDIVRYNTRAYENALFNLKSSNGKANGKVVLIKSIDIHPLSRRPQHVDFFALDLTKTVRVSVEIRTEGKPVGVAEGGLLNVVLRSVEVECLPTEIPEFIMADVSGLGLGDALHVSDLKVGNLKLITGAEQTVAVVNTQEEEVVAAPVAAPAAAAAAPAAAAKAGAPAAKAAAPAKK